MACVRSLWKRSALLFRIIHEKGRFTRSTIPAFQAHTKTENLDEVPQKPVQFSISKAATWKAKETRSGGTEEGPWYQIYVVSASIAIFMAYFCIFREENDIDEEFGKSLYDRIEGLEELHLEQALDFAQSEQEISAIRARLQQLQEEKKKGIL